MWQMMRWRDLEWFASLDGGFNAPLALYWWLCLPDGRFHIVREWKESGVYANEIAERFWKITRGDLGLARPRYVVAGGDIDAKHGLKGDHGETVYETLQWYGLPMKRADRDRKNGWYRLHELLRMSPYGTPWLTADPSCTYLCRTIAAAPSDRDDPDELDSHFSDDHGLESCFPAGTVITAERGDVPIETLGLSDRVWTRQGWKPVDAVFSGGVKPTVMIHLADGGTLQATPDHRVWVNGDFRQASDVRYGDMMRTCPVVPRTTSALARYGRGIAALFRRAGTSIIETVTGRIMSSQIWSACRRDGISNIMPSIVRWYRSSAISAGPTFDPRSLRLSFAATTVNLHIAVPAMLTTWDVYANAAQRSGAIAMSPLGSALAVVNLVPTCAPVPLMPAGTVADSSSPRTGARSGAACAVVSVQDGPYVQVYNITVRDAHEYFANGLLVSNCRYGAMSRPTPTAILRTAPIGGVGKLMREAMRANGPQVLGADAVRRTA